MPSAVDKIIKKLEESGYEAYAVGGCVRDSVMDKEPSDWDICTSSLPEETLECLGAENIIKNGLKHGTVTVRIEEENYEITTFRTDGEYLDNTGSKEDSLDPYFVNNLEASYTFKLPHIKAITAGVSIYNLFGEKYETNGYSQTAAVYSGDSYTLVSSPMFYPMAGTNLLVHLTFKF